MNTDSLLTIWPDDPGEDASEWGLGQTAAALALAGVAMVALLAAVVLQSGYRAVVSLWIWFVLPLVLLAARSRRSR